MLEVIDKGTCSQAHPVPLLFVHGAWHAAWCWDEHFLDFFAEKGYRALAVSLRGHGNSPTLKPLRSCSIAQYVDDVASVAGSLPTRPVVIGHSMGGCVVQKYLESHQAPAGVLPCLRSPAGNPWGHAAIREATSLDDCEGNVHRRHDGDSQYLSTCPRIHVLGPDS
jgi:pimeloyl-ACP methyl ester carboxylesterase